MITGGTIRYEDGRKAAEDYTPARKAVVELKFEVPEGGDPTKEADLAQAEAMARVNEMLDGKGVVEAKKRKVAPQPAAVVAAPVEQPKPEEIGNDVLLAAVTKKNAEIEDAPRILTIISKFIPEGAQAKIQQIAQDKRQAFLDELAKVAK